MLLAVLVVLDLAFGDFEIPVGDVVSTLLGGGDPASEFIVKELRLPQTLVAMLTGMALGLAGALTQTFARNPLASPDILGITEGAAFGAVAVIVLSGACRVRRRAGLRHAADHRVPIAAFLGGLLTAAALYVLSWRRGIDGQRLVLIGIGLGATLSRGRPWLLVKARIQDAASAQVWLTGSLNARGWEHAIPLLLTLAVLVPLSLLLVRHLNALQLGDDSARGLGIRLQTTQLLTLVAAVGLALGRGLRRRPTGVRRLRRATDRAPAHRRLAPADAGIDDARRLPGRWRGPGHPRRDPVPAPCRAGHGRHRRAVPDLAPAPHQPEGHRHDVTTQRADGLTVGYGGDPVVHDLTVDIPDGQVTTIVGPNGCGKSTLLRTLARLLSPTSGQVVLDGAPITSLGTRDIATRLSLLPQSPIAPEGLLVRDLIGRGRHPHQRWFAQWSPQDEDVVDAAMAMTDTSDLRDRPLDQLSGGQRQRAWIAMTLAQDTDLMLLDEPTTYLDLAHQVEVLDLVCRLNRERSRTVVMVLHDLNLAARYSDLVVVMHDGRIVTQGPPTDVFTAEMLSDVFGLEAEILSDPRTGLPIVVPMSSSANPAAGAISTTALAG